MLVLGGTLARAGDAYVVLDKDGAIASIFANKQPQLPGFVTIDDKDQRLTAFADMQKEICIGGSVKYDGANLLLCAPDGKSVTIAAVSAQPAATAAPASPAN